MENLDLNINNYSKEDLELFLNLKQSYDLNELNKNVDSIREKLSNYEDYVKGPVFDFLEKATNILKSTMNIPYYTETLTAGRHHNVQIEPVTPAVNTYNNNFPTGKVNPVERNTITKILCIDTLFRDNYDTTSPTNFTYDLPNPQNNVIELKIVSLELMNSWYMFSDEKKNNFFSIYLYNIANQADSVELITIPSGNYLSDGFVAMMNNLFASRGNGLQFLRFGINGYTGQCYIRATNIGDVTQRSLYNPADANYSPNFYFTIDFNNGKDFHKTAGWMMGFRKPTYTVTINNVNADSISQAYTINYSYYLESESTFGNNIDDYVFVVVDDFNRNFITDAVTTNTVDSYIGNNILGKIQITNNFQSILFHNPTDKIFKTRQYLGPIYLKKLKIGIIDRYGEYIDIKDTNYSIAFELTILY
jgi:hypothetical protein